MVNEDKFLEENHDKFFKSLEEHPINAFKLMDKLKEDLGSDFTVEWKEENYNRGLIVISW